MTILKNSKKTWLAGLLLAAGLAATGIVYWQAHHLVSTELSSKLDSRARDAMADLDRQMDAYVEALRGLRTQFAVNPDLSRPSFQKLASSLSNDQRLPGVKRIGFAQRAKAGQLAELEALLRREHAEGSLGYPPPALPPESQQGDTYVVRFAEPIASNASVAWSDQAGEPKRRAAVERARDSGEWALSGRVSLSREAANLDGIILYMPVYRGGVTPPTLDERRDKLVGMLSMSLRLNDVMHTVFSDSLLQDMRIRIHDADSDAQPPGADDAASFVYDSAAELPVAIFEAPAAEGLDLARHQTLTLGGRKWQLTVTPTPTFMRHSHNWLPMVLAVAGAALSLLLFVIARMLELSRQATLLHNREIERSLHSKEKQLTGITESIDEVLWTFDVPGWQINYVSPAVQKVYGHPAQAFYADRNLWLRSVHPADRQKVVALSRTLAEHRHQSLEYRIVRPDGQVRRIRYDAYYVPAQDGGAGRVDSVGRDITVQYQLQQSLLRSNRALRAMHDCESVIAGAADEYSLLQRLCDVMVADGYRMAWAGVLHADGGGSIVPVAITGAHQGYLAHLEAPLLAGLHGRATLGEALRSRRAVVVNSFERDPRLAEWRSQALKRGYHAKIVLPLFHDIQVMGILNVYADEQDAFDAKEVELMTVLAQRVSSAMQSLRHRSARRAAEAALKLRQRAIEAATNAIIITSASAPHYAVEYVNPAFERITGYGEAEILGRGWDVLLGKDRDQPALAELRQALAEQRECTVLLRNYRKDGSLFWTDLHLAPVRDDDGVVRHFVAAQYDVTEMKRYESELERQARHDLLTGLPNRALLSDRLREAIERASRTERPVWIAFVDLDRFKMVNDSLGHQAGDALLKVVSERLRRVVRESDTVARLGGDEFILIMAEAEDSARELGPEVMRRVLETVAQPVTISGHEFFPTCSIGVAAYPQDGTDPEILMSHADIAMYRAKEMGRNNFQFFTEAMNRETMERLKLESDLRHALERGELELHYQPQVSLHSGCVVGVEALLRWNHPELGAVAPARFIGLAEETGLIVEVGQWVLRTACAQAYAWQRAGLGSLRVAVNLSARQFAQPDLVESVASALRESGLKPADLDIELTESLVMTDVERAIDVLRELKSLGVQLSIDDFGTGYSSLAYLKRFPIDVLKIDRSFVCDIGSDPDDAAIVTSIISLAHSLQLQVIAEGVESREQLAYLRRHGCDELQGYYFSRPLAAAGLEQLLRQGRNLVLECSSYAA